MNRAQIQTVIEDLEYLSSDWVKDISDPKVRRGSAILRRLLVEDAYGRAWRAIGLQQQPKVIAVDIKNFLGSAPQSDVEIALPAGVPIGKVMMAGICLLNVVTQLIQVLRSRPTVFLESENIRSVSISLLRLELCGVAGRRVEM